MIQPDEGDRESGDTVARNVSVSIQVGVRISRGIFLFPHALDLCAAIEEPADRQQKD